MEETPGYIATCPSCQEHFRIPVSTEGTMVACRKCGSEFSLTTKCDPVTPVQDPSPGTHDGKTGIDGDPPLLLMGKLAEKLGYITHEQLLAVLRSQKEKQLAKEPGPADRVLVQEGLITEEQMEFLLSFQEMRKTRTLDRQFGQMAVNSGIATPEDIEDAFQVQKTIFMKTKSITILGDLLVDQGTITKSQRDAILLSQQRLEDRTAPFEEVVSDEEETETSVDDIQLTVTEDKLLASLTISESAGDQVTLDRIKNFLESRAIRYGIVSDGQIEKYLSKLADHPKPLTVAQGEKPLQAKDAVVTYYFDTDPLKIGTLRDGGGMDFHDRGEIPQVKKGALLARKAPCSPGQPGRDVFGDKIEASKPKDLKFRCGKGTERSEDGLEVRATLDGAPRISADGKISVFPRLHIPGDVGLGTGHVTFDGEVEVRGSIQDGFRVTGGRLAAEEILKAEVTISGDITVSGGIIGASIRCDGNLKTRYIHQSRIHALGDVVVEKEVIDSDIMSSGAFHMNRGTMFNSRISSKMGIDALQIGSAESKPCTLSVGVDEEARKKIENLRDQKTAKKIKQKKIETVIQKLHTGSRDLHKEIGELAQVQDRGSLKKRELEGKKTSLQKLGDEKGLSEILLQISGLQKEIHRAETRLDRDMGALERMTEKIESLNRHMEAIENDIAAIREDIKGVYDWSESTGGMPVVRAEGTVFALTSIMGPHSTICLREDFVRCLIKEREIHDPDARESRWEMLIDPLK